jgi:hypothetical protein
MPFPASRLATLKLSDDLQNELKRLGIKTVLAMSKLTTSDVHETYHKEIKMCLDSFDKDHSFKATSESDADKIDINSVSDEESDEDIDQQSVVSMNLKKFVKTRGKNDSEIIKSDRSKNSRMRQFSASSSDESDSKKSRKKKKKTKISSDSESEDSSSDSSKSSDSFSSGNKKPKTKFMKFLAVKGRELHLLFSSTHMAERGNEKLFLSNFKDFGEAMSNLIRHIKEKAQVDKGHIILFCEKILKSFTIVGSGKGGLKTLSIYYSKLVVKSLKMKTDLDVIKNLCTLDKNILKKSQKGVDQSLKSWDYTQPYSYSDYSKPSYNRNSENWWRNQKNCK